MKKAELRKNYISRRNALPADSHSKLSGALTERLFAEIDFRSIGFLHCYISLAHVGEVQTQPIFSHVWSTFPDIVTTAPRMSKASGDIESLLYLPNTTLVENSWRIPEPEGGEIVAPEALDAVIVPLLCFDKMGHRVGYGKGYYDRFLQKCRPDCIKVGLSFFPPVESIDDVHDADIPLSVCITPVETFRFG